MRILLLALALLAGPSFASGTQAPVANNVGEPKSWISGSPLVPTPGTLAVEEHFTWDGIDRTAIVIYPDHMPAGKAPAIVLLHYEYGNSAVMANLTSAGTLAAKMGYWVILPQAINDQWSDDPRNPNETTDDIGFLSSMIGTLTSQHPIDPQRVSMSGFSNGGFMTETMICQRPDLIASAVVVAAELRVAEKNVCSPSRPVPTVIVMGTDDPIVPYTGYEWTMLSATQTFNWWRGVNGCNPTLAPITTNLPVAVNDGTSVVEQTDANCSSRNEVDLYTVNGGGHAWPGSAYDTGAMSLGYLGARSMNLDTTQMLGQFASRWINTQQ